MHDITERRPARGQGGFTLIELLVVVAILGLLAGVVVFAVTGVRDDAAKKACLIERRTIQTAVEAYKASETTTDTVGTFLENGAAPKYFSLADGTRTNTADVAAADCANLAQDPTP